MGSLPLHFNDEFKPDGSRGYTALAGGAGDNVEVTGPSIDRMPNGEQGFDAASVLHGGTAALDTAETLSIRTRIEESDDDSSFDAAVELEAPTVVATGIGAAISYNHKVKVDLRGRKRFFRILTTPDLSRGATDTADGAAIVAVGGAKVLPVTST